MNKQAILKYDPLKIELGAGTRPRKDRKDGWIFSDLQAYPGIDLVAPCSNLGLPVNSVSEIFSSHLIEHIPWDLTPKILMYWYSLLKPGGSVEILCPNCEYAMRLFLKASKEGKLTTGMVHRVLWGTRNAGTPELPPHNEHHAGFTKNTLKIYLAKSGFINIVVEDFNRFGIPDRDIHAIAYKK